MKRIIELAMLFVVAALVSAMATGARAADDPAKSAPATSAGTAALSSGEVRQIDKSAGKITLKHGPLVNLDMPPMTMVFRVKDAAMLDQVKTGDKVAFVAEKVNGTLTVTRLEAGK